LPILPLLLRIEAWQQAGSSLQTSFDHAEQSGIFSRIAAARSADFAVPLKRSSLLSLLDEHFAAANFSRWSPIPRKS
jgi:hypothetical protein